MVFPWYAALLATLGALLLIAILSIIVLRILRANARLKREQNDYAQVATDEGEENISKDEKQTVLTRFKHKHNSVRSNVSWDSTLDSDNEATGLQNVTVVKEKYAETCASDVDLTSEKDSLSAYGDTNGRSDSLRADSLRMDMFPGPTSPRLQISLIYNAEKKYIAGKVTRITDLPGRNASGPHQIKVHLVLLPAKRYMLKSRYHSVDGSGKMDEYFKMKFKMFPDLETTAIRYRVYGKRVRMGVSGKEKCLGEAFVALEDVARTKGGVTMWKNILPKGLSAACQYPE